MRYLGDCVDCRPRAGEAPHLWRHRELAPLFNDARAVRIALPDSTSQSMAQRQANGRRLNAADAARQVLRLPPGPRLSSRRRKQEHAQGDDDGGQTQVGEWHTPRHRSGTAQARRAETLLAPPDDRALVLSGVVPREGHDAGLG